MWNRQLQLSLLLIAPMKRRSEQMTSDRTGVEKRSKVNPLIKLGIVFVAGISTAIFPSLLFGAVVIVAMFVVAVTMGQLRAFLTLMLTFGIPISLMLLFVQGCFSADNVTPLFSIGSLTFYREGVLYAARIVLTVLVFLGGFQLFNKSTRPAYLVAALASIGMPPKASYLVLASLNVVPQMQRQMGTIREAQAARGQAQQGNVIARLRAFIPLLGTVVMASLADSQERGMTLETRGFGIKGVKRTALLEVPFRFVDWLLGTLLIVLLGISVYAAISG